MNFFCHRHYKLSQDVYSVIMPGKPRGIDFGNKHEAVTAGKKKVIKAEKPLGTKTSALRGSNKELRKMDHERIAGVPNRRVVIPVARGRPEPMKRGQGARAYDRARKKASNARDRQQHIRSHKDVYLPPEGAKWDP